MCKESAETIPTRAAPRREVSLGGTRQSLHPARVDSPTGAKIKPIKDTTSLVGKRFGNLTVLSRAEDPCPHARWLCVCDCGRETLKFSEGLKCGQSRSCGCMGYKHGQAKHSKTTKTYVIYHGMKQRCLNPKHQDHHSYGGRGIMICPRWLESYENFFADMGECPAKYSIERINPDGNYEPSNCKWIPHRDQSKNRSKSNLKTHCRHGHEYTPENTYIRPEGEGRGCRACTRINQQKYKLRKEGNDLSNP